MSKRCAPDSRGCSTTILSLHGCSVTFDSSLCRIFEFGGATWHKKNDAYSHGAQLGLTTPQNMPTVPPADILSKAHSFLATSIYAQLDPWVLNVCNPTRLVKKRKRDEKGFYTWHPENSCFFTVIKVRLHAVVLHCIKAF
jgi:hypothetical protein